MSGSDYVRAVLYPQAFYKPHDPLPFVDDVELLGQLGDADGHISLSEFVLLKTMMAIPDDHIEVAFHMMDTDNSGTLSPTEVSHVLCQLTRRALAASSDGREDEAGGAAGIDAEQLPQRLGCRLFGRKYLNEKTRDTLSISRAAFHQFLLELREAQHAVQFRYFAGHDDATDTMTAHEFGRFLVAYSSPVHIRTYLARLMPLHAIDSAVFSLRDFSGFLYALNGHAADINDALTLFLMSSGSCTMSACCALCVQPPRWPTLSDPVYVVATPVFLLRGRRSAPLQRLLNAPCLWPPESRCRAPSPKPSSRRSTETVRRGSRCDGVACCTQSPCSSL